MALTLALPARASAADADGPVAADLLRRLAESDARIQQLYREGSYTLTTRMENLDPKTGKVQSTTDMVTRMFRKNGKPWEEVVSFIDAGKDETESHRAKREKEVASGKRDRTDSIPWQSPFGAEHQALYRFRDGGPTDGGTHEIIHYETLKPAKERGSGDAIVDPEAGTALLMRFQPSVLGNFVHSIQVEMRFDASTPAGPALSSFVVDGEGGLLFVKRRLHVEGTVVDYQMPPPMTASSASTAGIAAP